jgi:hypothetical protein
MFQNNILVCFSSMSICNLLIALPTYFNKYIHRESNAAKRRKTQGTINNEYKYWTI